MLTACGGSSSATREPLARHLPDAPGFAQPVEVPTPKKGESAVGVAARERAGRIAANGRLTAFRDWYDGVRRDYAR